MLITTFVLLFINLLNAQRGDVLHFNECCNKPSPIWAFYDMKLRKFEPAGKRYGLLTIVEFSHVNKDGKSMYVCDCDCGNRCVKNGKTLKSGAVKSCGCYKTTVTKLRSTKHGYCVDRKKPAEYFIWRAMKDRCSNPKNKAYHNYGGRGIKVCDRWLNSFPNFIADMGMKPFYGASIERIDNNGNYCPENCKWIHLSKQGLNQRRNKRYLFDGKMLTISEISSICGVKSSALYQRIHRGWSDARMLAQPISKTIRIKGDNNGR